MEKVLCIYGTTSGNTEMVVEKIAEILQQEGQAITLQRVEKTKSEELNEYDLILLASSTYGHGILQDYFIPFAEEIRKMNFPGKKFAVVGLGDSKYDREYNIESAAILEEIIAETKGTLLCPSLKINKSPLPHLNAKVAEWAKELAHAITNDKIGKDSPLPTPDSF